MVQHSSTTARILCRYFCGFFLYVQLLISWPVTTRQNALQKRQLQRYQYPQIPSQSQLTTKPLEQLHTHNKCNVSFWLQSLLQHRNANQPNEAIQILQEKSRLQNPKYTTTSVSSPIFEAHIYVQFSPFLPRSIQWFSIFLFALCESSKVSSYLGPIHIALEYSKVCTPCSRDISTRFCSSRQQRCRLRLPI